MRPPPSASRRSLAGSTRVVLASSLLTDPAVQTSESSSAALVVAALAAEGESELLDVFHLERGYECFGEKLRGLGAAVERVGPEAARLGS